MLVIDVAFEPARTDLHKSYARPVIGIHIGMYLKDKSGKGLFVGVHHTLFGLYGPR